MPAELFFESVALGEIGAAQDWYQAQSPGLGAALLADVKRAIDLLREAPLAGAFHEQLGARAIRLHRFPYLLCYLASDDGSAIRVVAFAHTKRRPGYWRG